MDVIKLVKGLLLGTCTAFSLLVSAQERKPTLIIQKPLTSTIPVQQPDSVEQRDLIDVMSMLLKKPISKEKQAITEKPSFTVVPAVGYTLQSKLVGSLTGNAVFHYKDANISTISAVAGYSQLKQFTVPVESNIWVKQNKLNLIGDFRFYKYPQSTFGLGSGSSIRNEDPMSYSFFRFYEIVLTPVAKNLAAGLGYIFDHHWNITDKGLSNGHPSDYSQYGKASHTISSGITLNSVYEKKKQSHQSFQRLLYQPAIPEQPGCFWQHHKLAVCDHRHAQIHPLPRPLRQRAGTLVVQLVDCSGQAALPGSAPAIRGTVTRAPAGGIYKAGSGGHRWSMRRLSTATR